MNELLVNVTPSETRVALVVSGILSEIYIERSSNSSMVGNVYRGKVSRVLPGMQAAFVDIGHEKAAFLHASDIVPHTECVNQHEKEHFKACDISTLVRPVHPSNASFPILVTESGILMLLRLLRPIAH